MSLCRIGRQYCDRGYREVNGVPENDKIGFPYWNGRGHKDRKRHMPQKRDIISLIPTQASPDPRLLNFCGN